MNSGLNTRKRRLEESLGHELFVLSLVFALLFAAYHVWLGYKEVQKKEAIILVKQQEVDLAWKKVEEAKAEVILAYERKAKLEEDSKKIQEKIDTYEKRILEVRSQYKRLDRIQKDLDRIIGK